MYDDILLDIRRPGQYIGGEWNVSKKDFSDDYVKFALSFPDLYEVGMSNLGIRIIYGMLNSMPQTLCERFFSVDIDMESQLRAKGREILSLESRKRLIDFDLVGFSLGSELCYSNVLGILDLAGLPLRANERTSDYPLVVGGGPCTLNPEPMHEFFDFFVIGEGESVISEIVEEYRKYKLAYKSKRISKPELLTLLSKIEGVYIPSFYDVVYDADGVLKEFKPNNKEAPAIIKKRFVRDLNTSYYPKDWLIPYTQVIHDRAMLEVMRGCPNHCRFCQARSQYYPLRYRQPGNVLSLADAIYKNTGYEEFSLSGLSVSDYPFLTDLLNDLSVSLRAKGVSFSLPSVKARLIMGAVSSLIAKFKKTGLTFAPEAGSQRLRDLLAKDFKVDDFFNALRGAYSCGYQHLKLYFMIGIPKEEDVDLDEILNFSTLVSETRKDIGKPAAAVNISVNTLIPKPHTPLQWFAMLGLEGIRYKQDYIRSRAVKRRKLRFNYHFPEMSIIEGVLSRGDRRLSEVILAAFKKGARFDAWGNRFNYSIWQDSFKECGINQDLYLQAKKVSLLLPWDFIDTGINRGYLVDEFNKTIAL
jgi:radical SAM family uncharacterized protein